MGIDTHVTRRTRQRLSFPIGNVLLCLRVSVLLGHTKVNDMDDVCSFRAGTTNEEVVGFDISVDEILLVDGLDARQLQGGVSTV